VSLPCISFLVQKELALFFKKDFIYLRKRGRESMSTVQEQREREKQTPH